MTSRKEALAERLRDTIALCSRDEDLPFWGEVFVLLHEMKKVPAGEMPLYELEPAGEVVYDRPRRVFIVRIPDMDIVMKDTELADAIVKKGIFRPRSGISPERQGTEEPAEDRKQEGGYM